MCSMYKNGRKKTVFNEFLHAFADGFAPKLVQQSEISGQRSEIRDQWSVVSGQRSEISGQWSASSFRLSALRFREGCFQSQAREFWLALLGWTACPGRKLHFFLGDSRSVEQTILNRPTLHVGYSCSSHIPFCTVFTFICQFEALWS
jgi:hypothetical protein